MGTNTIAVLVTVAFSVVGVVGDYFLKLASAHEQPLRTWSFYLGFALYASTAFGWVFVMKHLKLATISVVYSVSMVLLLTAVGVVLFRESLNVLELAGIVMAVASLVLLIRFAYRHRRSMAAFKPESQAAKPKKSVMKWLLDSDPSIRWQVMRDLGDESDEVVAAERSRVASEGWGAQLLDRQRPDGKWGDGTSDPQWASTLHTLLLLRQMGLDPKSGRTRKAVSLLRDKVTWGPEFGDSPFFEGEVEPCINGGALALGAYFGEASDRLVDRLLGEQLEDGGWNCEAERGSVRSSFHTTICVLEGLLEYETAKGATVAVTNARGRAHEYLLERRMFRRLSSGEVIDRNWTRFSFPTTWHYDVLRGLDYLRKAGVEPDGRVAEAVGLVVKRRHQNGRWPLHTPHPDPVRHDMEGGAGKPSRWNTLRASRVLRWYSAH